MAATSKPSATSSTKVKVTHGPERDVIRWVKLEPRTGSRPGPGPRWGHTVNSIEDGKFLYVFGGIGKDRSRSNKLHVFEQETLRWTEPQVKGNPPSPRDSHTCTTVGNYLFVFGGTDGTKSFNDLHLLNTRTHTWTHADVTGFKPEPRGGHSAAYVKEKLIIFGGSGDSENGAILYNDLYILTSEFFWMRIAETPSFPCRRVGHSFSSRNDREIVLIGGEGSSNTFLSEVHVLDAESLEWHKLNTTGELFPPRAGHITFRFGSYLIVWGGFSKKGMHDDVHALNLVHGEWSKLASIGMCASPRCFMSGDSYSGIEGMEGVFAFFGGCNRRLEPIGDMYCMDTVHHERGVPQKSLREQLESKSLAYPAFVSRYELAQAARAQGITTPQPVPRPLPKPPGNQYQGPIHVLSSGKKIFQVAVVHSFSTGYNVETVIDGMPYKGMLHKNKPTVLRTDDNRKLPKLKSALKSTISSSPQSTGDDVMHPRDAQNISRRSRSPTVVRFKEMENPTPGESSKSKE